MQTNSGRESDANHSEAVFVDGVEAPAPQEQGHDVERLSVQDGLKLIGREARGIPEVVCELIDELAKDDVHERHGNSSANGCERGKGVDEEVPFCSVAEDSYVIGNFWCSLGSLGILGRGGGFLVIVLDVVRGFGVGGHDGGRGRTS